MSSPSKRREMDLMKLMMSDYKVETMNDGMQEFYVQFHGPTDSPYHGGVWKVRVELPDAYPYKSPSIGFVNKIYHPNVDEVSGSVCLDVINQTWTPMYDLVNVFEVFLPQLLLYPNELDPLNEEAAAMLMRDRTAYEQRVKAYTIGVDTSKSKLLTADVSRDLAIMQMISFVENALSYGFWLVMWNGGSTSGVDIGNTNSGTSLKVPMLYPLEYCLKYAKPEDAGAIPEEKSSDEELTEDEYESSDEVVLGPVDP
ncbi:hypothetical protein SASPL_111398 [Salvia splendens]|uniref:E2 ubiquitin-conjugating enzyme n=1 Tax=Salvia splendens TaxID=180675 RepID=A0A8X8YCF1_SALSN|nr:hypothetical protein SASPL_111398 [Salvia splendens]